MKKKICFYVDSIFSLGGIQRAVTEIANNLVCDYDITIFCLNKVDTKNQINYNLKEKIKVDYLPKMNIIYQIINIILKVLRFFLIKIIKISNKSKIYEIVEYKSRLNILKASTKYFNKNKYNYILAEGLPICIYLSYIKDKLNSSIVTIGCWHSSFEAYSQNNSENIIHHTLEKLNKTVVLSKTDQIKIKEKYNINVDYIYNPINKVNINGNSKKEKKFLAVGRYAKVKGYDNLIKAFNIFNQKNKEWKLEIVGEGPERKNLQKLINKYNLNDYVKLVGQTSEIGKYYSTAAFFLITSKAEGLSMVLLEAMQYKLPIIAFDIPVFHEILPPSVPIINQKNYIEFANKMIELINNKDCINNMVYDYDEYLEKFNINVIIKKWNKILK